MRLFSLVVLYLYINMIKLINAHSFNVSHSLALYSAVCGNSVCNKSLISDGTDIEDVLIFDRICPPCSCNKTCLVDGNCCPDMFFSFKSLCVNLDIVSENPFRQGKQKVLTVSGCPFGYEERTRQLCEMEYDTGDRFKNPPVTSLSSRLTYKNLHCAKCFNESSENLISWNMEIDCADFADFNFLSTFDEVISVSKDKLCDMHYSNNHIVQSARLCDPDENVVKSCNISGTWKNYDPDLDHACKTYDNKFHFFKNVFCYICNPPEHVGDIISKCNTTGLWFPFDAGLETACFKTEQALVTGQFKNIYCFLCNRNNITPLPIFHDVTALTFEHAEIKTENWLVKSAKFIFDYDMFNLNIDHVLQSGKTYLMMLNAENDGSSSASGHDNQTRENITSIDVPSVLKSYYAFTGISKFCQNYSVFEFLQPCNCDDSCYFSYDGCCIDKYFQKSTMCTDGKYSTFGQRYLVYDSCSDNQQHPLLNQLCSEKDERNLFSFLPTLLRTNNGNTEHYKNIYCALCNKNSNFRTNLFPWKLILECDVYIPSYFHISFEEYFKFAHDNNCKSYYSNDYLKSDVMTCEPQRYKHCNMTGFWRQDNKDILEACEHYNFPSGAFCSLCNPNNSDDIIYSTCNVTGLWDFYNPFLEEKCLKYPVIQSFAPFKNYFCKKCNEYFTPEPSASDPPYPTFMPPPTFPSYRTIFAFANYKEPLKDTTTTECNASQILNTFTNNCMDTVCYPGKILEETGCLPLLQTTQNLGYILSVGLDGELQYSVHMPLEFLKAVRGSFESAISNLLQLSNLDIETSHFVPNLTCEETANEWVNGTKVSISIYEKFFISQFVNRNFVEKQLVSLIGNFVNVSYSNLNYRFDIIKDEMALFLPNFLSKISLTENCFLSSTSANFEAKQYVHSHVNNLLLCEQIKLTKDEFELNPQTLKLKVKFTETDLTHDQYILSSAGNAQICVETFIEISRLKTSAVSPLTAWDVVQIIFTCVSLFCLLFTFITYCLFPSIRTLPGKNNMCLVFAMFCTHLLFQFIMLGSKSKIGCQILGILLHYFWLVTFACLNVCSFHMFRAFRSKTGASLSEKRALIRYVLYSFGTPALIIFLNITVTVGVSADSSVGYGGHICFLSGLIAFIITFFVPIVLICFANIFFFVSTSITIARRPKMNSEDQINSNQVHFVVYIKLFTITGITWIFQIIDSFLPVSAFSYIVSLLNTLQGLFIFISYVCNKRVYMLYSNSRNSAYKSSTNSSRRTINTRLNDSSM